MSTANPNWVSYCRALYSKATVEIDDLYRIAGKESLGPVHRLHGLLTCLNNTIPDVIAQLEVDIASLQNQVAELKSQLKIGSVCASEAATLPRATMPVEVASK